MDAFMMCEFDPVEVLRQDLADLDPEVQLEAVRNIPIVALAIGVQHTTDKLMPLINEYCSTDADGCYEKQRKDGNLGPREEVLRETAWIMNGTMVPLIGGQEKVLPILMLLQKLSMMNEGLVREAAVNSIFLCANEMDSVHIEKYVFPIATFLADGTEWTARSSAANSGPRMYCYLRSEGSKVACRNLVLKLIKDESPIVRCEAYSNIQHMVKPMADDNPEKLLEFITPILRSLTEEAQDHFRLNIVKIIVPMLKVQCEELLTISKDYLLLLCEDNWFVRKNLLLQMMEITDAAGTWTIVDEVLPFFVRALMDPEPSIRLVALEIVPKFVALWNITPVKLKELVTRELIKELLEDESLEVREAASGVIIDMLLKIHRTDTEFKDLVVDTMDKIYYDEPEVRVNFCKCLDKALELCGEDNFVNYLLPLIPKIQEDAKWRVRAGILQHIKIFAGLYLSEKITEKELLSILEAAFSDPVSAVRQEGFKHIAKLVDSLGPDWVIKSFLKIIEQFQCKDVKCGLRIVPIRISQQLFMAKADDKCPGFHELQKAAIVMISKGSEDAVDNVRLACVDALMAIIKSVGVRDHEAEIRKALEILKKDQDREIRYHGTEGLSLLECS